VLTFGRRLTLAGVACRNAALLVAAAGACVSGDAVADWQYGLGISETLEAVSNREFPSRNVFTKDDTAPADIVSINGYVLQGRVHAHLTLASPEHAFGGHLEPDTHVFTFAIVTLAELSDDMDVSRFDDKTHR